MWCNRLVQLSQLAAAAAALTTHVHDTSFVPDAVLHVTSKTVGIGGIRRLSVLVNGTVPGPPVVLPEDKIVWVRVYNDMEHENVTMHWHGLTQAAYPFSDGSPLASQWPIPPQRYFDYELKSPNGTAGTYFYHSHVGFQASSAHGPLIARDSASAPAPYRTDFDKTIHISELFNATDAEVVSKLTGTPFRWPGDAMAWLVNGQTIPASGVTDPASARLHVINVDPGRSYRFRFIGATGLGYAAIGFQNHTRQWVIEADGHYTQPEEIDILQLGSGQRFSTLFKAKSCSELQKLGKLDYYVQIESRDRPVNVTSYAILRYRNSCKLKSTPPLSTTTYPATRPQQLPPIINGYLDYKLKPLRPNNFPAASQVTRRIVINTQLVGRGYYVWESNNATWSEDGRNPVPHTTPREPYLVSLYKNQTAHLPDYAAAVANGGLDPATRTYPAKMGEVLEIVIQQLGSRTHDGLPGGSLDTHPWHAHGKHYYDIGGGEGAYDPAVAEQRLQGTQPVQRDTTMLFRYTKATQPDQVQGWRAWRLRVEAPGVWMVHCHTIPHMIQGMQTVWVFGGADDILRVGRPDVTGYLEYGGNVNGNVTHPAQVLHFSELD